MQLHRKLLYSAASLFVAGLGTLAIIEVRAQRTPLSVGATADEAWTYIHSPAAWGSESAFLGTVRSGWTAHAYDIQCDIKHYFHGRTNKYVFATQQVTYILGTNGTITAKKSTWKWIWPSKSNRLNARNPHWRNLRGAAKSVNNQ